MSGDSPQPPTTYTTTKLNALQLFNPNTDDTLFTTSGPLTTMPHPTPIRLQQPSTVQNPFSYALYTDNEYRLPLQQQEPSTTLPATQRRLLNTYHQTADDLTVWKALRSQQTLTISSDGGLKTNKGTYGWEIVTNTDEV
jgi:hypothetical protein